DTVEGIAELYRFDSFDHFVETWLLTTQVTRTPDDFRRVVIDYAAEAARHGCVYIEGTFSPAQPVRRGSSWQEVFAAYCAGGPHAGEAAGPESIRGALDALGAVRLRHGIRAVEDPALLRELAERRIVLDTCLASNICTGLVRSLEQHPLPQLVAAGVPCTLST